MVKLESWKMYHELHRIYDMGIPPIWTPSPRLSDHKTIAPPKSYPPPPPAEVQRLPTPTTPPKAKGPPPPPPESERPQEPKAVPATSAPDGAARVEQEVPGVFPDIKCPSTDFAPIELVRSNRPPTQPFLTRKCSDKQIRGPLDWPNDTPVDNMTATYVPIQADIRWTNTNYRGKPENPDEEPRLGLFHYFNETWRRHLIDHLQLMGDETLLHEAKAQTYVRGADSAEPWTTGISSPGNSYLLNNSRISN